MMARQRPELQRVAKLHRELAESVAADRRQQFVEIDLDPSRECLTTISQSVAALTAMSYSGEASAFARLSGSRRSPINHQRRMCVSRGVASLVPAEEVRGKRRVEIAREADPSAHPSRLALDGRGAIGNETGRRPASASDDDLLARLRAIDELREARLGVIDVDLLAHGLTNLVSCHS